ncbi:hypothetical protein MXM82_07785 [Pseudomonas asiatica]|uniref:hypothetical protein n=1 Tax=Pseudomonas asiatica TaxID=2219225 RepID=UPI002DBAE336|nr:hypothetical protein [Pseudomonas asiatica]MEB6589037.1 hypothetical protein [Pseudomonas asiatica]
MSSPDIEAVVTNILPLLKEYRNNGLEFYKELYINEPLSISIAFFGHDFSGCYGIDTTDNHIKYVTKEDGAIRVVFCNSIVVNFLHFNNSFIDLACERIASGSNNFESKITGLMNAYSVKDPLAMKCENNFWPLRLYELEEDFFPLDNSKIKLYCRPK